jgi:hypothetical protein
MPKRTFVTIVYLIAGFTLISCALGVFNNDIYRDGSWIKAQWLGHDVITLFLAFPLLLISLNRGVVEDEYKWKLVIAGILLYYIYTYSFFIFGAELTLLYLFHLPIFALSIVALKISLFDIFRLHPKISIPGKSLPNTICIYLFSIGLTVAVLWLTDIIAHLTIPDYVSQTPNGKAPLIIYSLDLAIILPLMIFSAIQLIQKTQTGYIITAIMLVNSTMLGFALMAGGVSKHIQNLSPVYFLILIWCVMGIFGTVLTLRYLKNLQTKNMS